MTIDKTVDVRVTVKVDVVECDWCEAVQEIKLSENFDCPENLRIALLDQRLARPNKEGWGMLSSLGNVDKNLCPKCIEKWGLLAAAKKT